MELRDFIVTPLLLILIAGGAWMIRPYCTDDITRKYFFPGLIVKILGALAVGLIYQFYYDGGDTFSFHTHGSRVIWEAFAESPSRGFQILFSNGHDPESIYRYTSRIYFYRDPSSFFIIRLSAIFDLFTFSSYSATAILFSIISFIGSWMFFLTFYEQYPHLHKPLAWAALFIPSVIFWGSGLLKDTITLAFIGIATYQIYKIFLVKRVTVFSVLLLLASLFVVFTVKKFILQAYIPSAIVWVFAARFYSIRSVMLRFLLIPVILVVTSLLAYYSVVKVGEGDERYSVDRIARTARVTAYDIRFWSGRNAGSGYSLGVLDDSFGSLIRLAPAAINVSLFRPYLWEVKNPLMLMSSLESLVLLAMCLAIVYRLRLRIFKALRDPNIVYCLIFSFVFAFAVGVSTFNFGTLSRYKITMLPFFLTALVLLYHSNNSRNDGVIAATE